MLHEICSLGYVHTDSTDVEEQLFLTEAFSQIKIILWVQLLEKGKSWVEWVKLDRYGFMGAEYISHKIYIKTNLVMISFHAYDKEI